MSDIPTTRADRPRRYEIRVRGQLASRWAAWFAGLTLTTASDGTTLLHGPVPDQAALHGVLAQLRDMGLPLISVTEVEPLHGEASPPDPDGINPPRRTT